MLTRGDPGDESVDEVEHAVGALGEADGVEVAAARGRDALASAEPSRLVTQVLQIATSGVPIPARAAVDPSPALRPRNASQNRKDPPARARRTPLALASRPINAKSMRMAAARRHG